MMTKVDTRLSALAGQKDAPHALVVGAGLGGLASAMRLGARGYRVTVLDRLDVPGGRGAAGSGGAVLGGGAGGAASAWPEAQPLLTGIGRWTKLTVDLHCPRVCG